ncbi:TRAP transporter small permease [Thioclava sp. GXIMD2076]|uniref:TRAP transporter small permease protein n=1 Tax=Thioclava kandeliae TaxID=3070818 RepID=A0ABV1SG98_9RHOB
MTRDNFPRVPETDPSSGRKAPVVPRNGPRLALGLLCGAMLLAMMGLTVVDVIGRYLFNAPLIGATELTEMLLCAVIFLGLPAVCFDRDHVTVDLVIDRLPAWLQPWRELAVSVFSVVVLGVVSWRIWVYAAQKASYGEATNSLRLPIAPLGYLCALCCAVGVVLTLVAALRQFRLQVRGR